MLSFVGGAVGLLGVMDKVMQKVVLVRLLIVLVIHGVSI
jgi:hypothetical protein